MTQYVAHVEVSLHHNLAQVLMLYCLPSLGELEVLKYESELSYPQCRESTPLETCRIRTLLDIIYGLKTLLVIAVQ